MNQLDSIQYTIEPWLQKRLDILDTIAKCDSIYQNMFAEYTQLEKQFFAIEQLIPAEQRDIIWDYFDVCNAMTHRLAELACMYMEFPKSKP